MKHNPHGSKEEAGLEEVPDHELYRDGILSPAPNLVYDPTVSGLPRWTDRNTGRAVVRQPYMTDAQWDNAIAAFVKKTKNPK